MPVARSRSRSRHAALAAALALLAAAAAPSPLRAHPPGHPPGPVTVELRDRATGAPLAVHAHDGRRWVVGEPRREYAIRVRNRTAERVLVVVAVDGVNVVSGETAATSQGGYVLEPWGAVTIDGWRKSLDRVAAFYFAPLAESYAARTGRPADVGVIGVAAFRERAPEYAEFAPLAALPAAPPYAAEAAPAPSAAGSAARSAAAESADVAADAARAAPRAQARSRLGTGHGRALDSRAEWTAFERASATPDAVVELRYDSRRNLVARGVLAAPRPAWHEPRAFPAGFVPDP